MSIITIELKIGHDIPLDKLLELYNSVGWSAYTRGQARDKLPKAICHSTYVVSAWAGRRLAGLARGLSDEVSIFYLQDILVHPDFQRQGIGRKLLANCLERFQHTRMKVLLTDDREEQLKFYESLGYVNAQKVSGGILTTFIKLKEK
ncbi:MAG: GNAT family N-acetyltransferase [Chloroflexota bacterium]|nr:GNAT family N-acetyltransferase [Chloroflexota bacterium]